MGFKDIKYDIPVCQMENTQIHKYINIQIRKFTNTQIHKYKVLEEPNMCYIFEKQGVQGYQI